MRKNIIGALIASAFAMSGTAHAGLLFDLNGSAGGGVINATAFDWTTTSFLARGGNTAIQTFASGPGGGANCGATNCDFEVLTHAKLVGYTPTGAGSGTGLPDGIGGSITMVARFTERVVGFGDLGTGPTAVFRSTGAGSIEFYYNAVDSTNDLTGFGFNEGRLIGRLTGVTVGAAGSFAVNDPAPIALDGFDGNSYSGQNTVSGSGNQQTIDAGRLGKDLDGSFFLTSLSGFSLNYTNLSIGVPYESSNPSHCFNDPVAGRVVGTDGYASSCDNTHTNGLFSANSAGGGYLANIGALNGFDFSSPDFVAQTDFNSAVTGVPEPGSLALVGLALAASGLVASRRRRA